MKKLTKEVMNRFEYLHRKLKQSFSDEDEIDARIDAENDLCGWLYEYGDALIGATRRAGGEGQGEAGLREALEQCQEALQVGERIFGTDFDSLFPLAVDACRAALAAVPATPSDFAAGYAQAIRDASRVALEEGECFQKCNRDIAASIRELQPDGARTTGAPAPVEET